MTTRRYNAPSPRESRLKALATVASSVPHRLAMRRTDLMSIQFVFFFTWCFSFPAFWLCQIE